jgi:uncharacterized integral membrane protein
MPDDSEPRKSRDSRDSRSTAKFVGIVVLVVVLAAFVIDNHQSVNVGFVVHDFDVPLIFVLVVTAIVGAVIDRLWQRTRR